MKDDLCFCNVIDNLFQELGIGYEQHYLHLVMGSSSPKSPMCLSAQLESVSINVNWALWHIEENYENVKCHLGIIDHNEFR